MPVVIYAAVLGFWGYVSLATVAGLLVFACAVALCRWSVPAKLAALGLLISARGASRKTWAA